MDRNTGIGTTVVTVLAAAAVGSAIAPALAAASAPSASAPSAAPEVTPATAFTLDVAYQRGGDIYVTTGLTERRLTTDRHSTRPHWSPDGARLAYLSATSLWVMNADGSGKRQAAAVASGGASWSPDGGSLAYVGPDCNGQLDVLTVSATTAGEPVSLLPTSTCARKRGSSEGIGQILPVRPTLAQQLKRDSTVAWSPDGRRIAFRGGDCKGIFDDCLSVADLVTGREVMIDGYGGGGQVFGGFGAVPAWRPDGGRLAWTAYTDGDSAATSVPVHVAESAGNGAARRTIGAANDRELAYVGTGRAVLTSTHRGGAWLTLVDLASGARTYLRPGSQPSPRSQPPTHATGRVTHRG
jgi:Tol biopolymer transport system component